MTPILILILLEGFVTISVEILAIRQLIPMVGNNVIVTSIIIGIFLLFLALGYLKGAYIRKDYLEKLAKNFTLANVWIGIGLSSWFIQLFFEWFYQHIIAFEFTTLTFYLLFIIAPIVYWLGQSLPILTNYFKYTTHVGAISGRALYWSTIGSFLGALATTLILFNWLGVASTVFINCLLLVLLLAVLTVQQPKLWFLLICSIIVLYMAFVFNIQYGRNLFVATNNYGDYVVKRNMEISSGRIGDVLLINHSFSSFIDHDKKGAGYIERIKTILFKELKLTHKKILVLGAGGFSLSAENNFDNEFTYVDIDPDIRKIVERYFISTIHGVFIAEDARTYVHKKNKLYDVVVSDVYSHKVSIPAHLLTFEYIKSIYDILVNDGIAVFNIIARPLLDDPFSKRVDNTIQSVFTNCMKIPTHIKLEKTNIIYVCYKHSNNNDRTIYTDNYNNSTLDITW